MDGSLFDYYGNATKIVIPNNVTSIGKEAFYHCKDLTHIVIPDSVTSIGADAFYLRTGLVIYGTKGSYAETYAKANDILFITSDEIPVISVTLDKVCATISVNNTLAIDASAYFLNCTDNITWLSDNPSVVTIMSVDEKRAYVKALKVGTANITVRAGEKSASCLITVKSLAKSIKFSPNTYNLQKGDTVPLSIRFIPSDSIDTIKSYTSSDPNVASVDSLGNLTALSPGRANIIAVTSQGTSASCSVQVSISATSIKLNRSAAVLSKGSSLTLIPTVQPTDTTDIISWESDDTNIATVNNGIVTGKNIGQTYLY